MIVLGKAPDGRVQREFEALADLVIYFSFINLGKDWLSGTESSDYL